MKTAVNAAIIKHKRILLVKKKDIWILPGGKLEEDESHLECLARKMREELSGTEIFVDRYYHSFEGQTPHTNTPLKAYVYLARLKGRLGEPSSEISEAEFVRNFKDYQVSAVTKEIIDAFTKEGYLK
jgi:8-oxo-dGTP diphosphatase